MDDPSWLCHDETEIGKTGRVPLGEKGPVAMADLAVADKEGKGGKGSGGALHNQYHRISWAET